MKIEEKFNRRSADLIEVQHPTAHVGSNDADLGIKLIFATMPGNDDLRTIAMHLTVDDALQLAQELIASARRVRR